MQLDTPPSEGIFAFFGLWLRVLEFTTPAEVCAFAQVSHRCNDLISVKNTHNESMWLSLLKRDYGMTEAMVKRFAKEEEPFRSLYIAFCRSRTSPTGQLTPSIFHKHVRRSARLRQWAKLHGRRPFFVMQLNHVSTHGPRAIVARYSPDETSYFTQVLELRRCWNIQVEGSTRVWRRGYYRIVWRLKLALDYEDLGPLNFMAKAVPSHEAKHLIAEEELERIEKLETTWQEEEIIQPIHLDNGTYTHYVWNPPNPMPLQPADVQQAAMHPNDRPFGALDPEENRRPLDDGFGFDAQQRLFGLHNRILQAQFNADAPQANEMPRQPLNADVQRNVQENGDENIDLGLPGLIELPNNNNLANNNNNNNNNQIRGMNHHNAGDRSSAFPVEQWFDLHAGFVHVAAPHDAVCFAITNFTIGYKYGLFIDYVALIPVTEAEFRLRHQFPLGPMLRDDFDYWDTLCYNADRINSRGGTV